MQAQTQPRAWRHRSLSGIWKQAGSEFRLECQEIAQALGARCFINKLLQVPLILFAWVRRTGTSDGFKGWVDELWFSLPFCTSLTWQERHVWASSDFPSLPTFDLRDSVQDDRQKEFVILVEHSVCFRTSGYYLHFLMSVASSK